MHRPAAKVGTPFVRSANARFVEARTLPSPAAPARPAAAAPRQPADNSSYADLVARSFEGTILRYSRRLALLEQADTRGIPRTEARQIIAAAQKRAQHAISPRSSRP